MTYAQSSARLRRPRLMQLLLCDVGVLRRFLGSFFVLLKVANGD